MKLLRLLVCVSAPWALAASAASTRICAIVIPLDAENEVATLDFESFMNQALREFQGFQVKTSEEEFEVATDVTAAATLKQAEVSFAQAKRSFDGRHFEEAERLLRSTITDYGRAAAALQRCGNLCEALAMYGAALHARGDLEEAKVALQDLLALAPAYKADQKRFAPGYLKLKAQVATTQSTQLRGSFKVATTPAGARVYLNGAFQGFSPVALQTVALGKALVTIERPGIQRHGAMIEVTPEQQDLAVELVPTPRYQAFQSLLGRVAKEALDSKPGPAISSLGTGLNLDQAMIGILRNVEGRTQLSMAYFDLKRARRLSAKRMTFDGDEYGQMQGEVARIVRTLVNNARSGGNAVSRSGDPLDSRHGTEEWNSEDRGGKAIAKEKAKSGDPLDSVSGTEDW